MKVKKIKFILYLCAMTFMFYSTSSFAEIITLSPYSFSVYQGEATLDRYIDVMSSLSTIYIPEEYNGYPVTKIGNSAFYGSSRVEKVVIPDSVREIEGSAFTNSKNLLEVVMQDSVTRIGTRAFAGCTKLETITFSNNIVSIGEDAFADSGYYNNDENWENDLLYEGKYLLGGRTCFEGDLKLKDGTEIIAESAFDSCKGITSVIIPESVIVIGENAFAYCSGITSAVVPFLGTSRENGGTVESVGLDYVTDITITESVHISDGAFAYCGNLKNITFMGEVTGIGYSAFSDCGSLESFVIPEGVTTIGGRAFWRCTSLKSITIPDTVTQIGNDAFYECISLESVTIPNSVKCIEDEAFDSCVKLKSITIPAGVDRIGKDAFYDCISLEEVIIEDGIKEIGDGAFKNCAGIKNIVIPNSVKRIEKDTFRSCKGLQAVTIGEGVERIESEAFYSCTGLKSIAIPDGVRSLGDKAFGYCDSLEDITIGCGMRSIGDDVFYDTKFYNTESNWTEGVLYIGDYLIKAKYDIRGDYKIKDGTVVIGNEAFFSCSKLTGIDIPDSVLSIGDYAFKSCSTLRCFEMGNCVENMGGYILINTPYYENEENWEDNALYLGEYLLGTRDGLQGEYAVKNGTRVVAAHSFNSRKKLTSVILPESVKNISYKAFTITPKLEKVTIYSRDVVFFSEDIFDDYDAVTMAVYKGSTADVYAKNTGVKALYIEDMVLADVFVTGSDLMINIMYGEKLDGKVIICGIFDADNRLVKAVMLPLKRATDTVYVVMPDEETYEKIKIMSLDSQVSLRPVKESVTVKIVR